MLKATQVVSSAKFFYTYLVLNTVGFFAKGCMTSHQNYQVVSSDKIFHTYLFLNSLGCFCKTTSEFSSKLYVYLAYLLQGQKQPDCTVYVSCECTELCAHPNAMHRKKKLIYLMIYYSERDLGIYFTNIKTH